MQSIDWTGVWDGGGRQTQTQLGKNIFCRQGDQRGAELLKMSIRVTIEPLI